MADTRYHHKAKGIGIGGNIGTVITISHCIFIIKLKVGRIIRNYISSSIFSPGGKALHPLNQWGNGVGDSGSSSVTCHKTAYCAAFDTFFDIFCLLFHNTSKTVCNIGCAAELLSGIIGIMFGGDNAFCPETAVITFGINSGGTCSHCIYQFRNEKWIFTEAFIKTST